MSSGAVPSQNWHDCDKDCESIHRNFVLKILSIIVNSRTRLEASSSNRSSSKSTPSSSINNWFSLDTDDDHSSLQEQLRKWSRKWSQPVYIDFILTLNLHTTHRVEKYDHPLVGSDPLDTEPIRLFVDSPSTGKMVEIDIDDLKQRGQRGIVLESWTITFKQHDSDSRNKQVGISMPILYQRAAVLVRSVFSILRILPLFGLCQKLYTAHPPLSSFSASKQQQHSAAWTNDKETTSRLEKWRAFGISYRISANHKDYADEISLEKSILQEGAFEPASKLVMVPLLTPHGSFTVSVTYRNHCSFDVAKDPPLSPVPLPPPPLFSELGRTKSGRLATDNEFDDDYFGPALATSTKQRLSPHSPFPVPMANKNRARRPPSRDRASSFDSDTIPPTQLHSSHYHHHHRHRGSSQASPPSSMPSKPSWLGRPSDDREAPISIKSGDQIGRKSFPPQPMPSSSSRFGSSLNRFISHDTVPSSAGSNKAAATMSSWKSSPNDGLPAAEDDLDIAKFIKMCENRPALQSLHLMTVSESSTLRFFSSEQLNIHLTKQRELLDWLDRKTRRVRNVDELLNNNKSTTLSNKQGPSTIPEEDETISIDGRIRQLSLTHSPNESTNNDEPPTAPSSSTITTVPSHAAEPLDPPNRAKSASHIATLAVKSELEHAIPISVTSKDSNNDKNTSSSPPLGIIMYPPE